MIEFLDGPAAGVNLDLRRAPLALRVVRGPRGKWDALDQLDDQPTDKETIFVYVRTSEVRTIFVCGRPRSQSGAFLAAKYRLLNWQPEDDQVRQTDRWREWVVSNRDLIQAKANQHTKAEQIKQIGLYELEAADAADDVEVAA